MNPDAAYNEYLSALGSLAALPARRHEALEGAQHVGRAEVDDAMAALRDVRTAVAAAEDDASRLSSRLARLGVRTRMAFDDVATPTDAPLTEGTVAETQRMIETLRQDMSAAEAAWGWVERASQQGERASETSAPPPYGTSASSSPTPEIVPDPPRGNLSAVRVAAILAAAVLVLAVVILMVF